MNNLLKKLGKGILFSSLIFNLSSKVFSAENDSINLEGIKNGAYYNKESKPDSVFYEINDTNFSYAEYNFYWKYWNQDSSSFTKYISDTLKNNSGKFEWINLETMKEANYLLNFKEITKQGDTISKKIEWTYDNIYPRIGSSNLPVSDTTYSTKEIPLYFSWFEPYLDFKESCYLINDKRYSIEENFTPEYNEGLNRVLIRLIDKAKNEYWKDVIFSINTTNIKENKSEFKVFPNPVKNNLNIENSEKTLINLYNFEGKKLESYNFESGENIIDLSKYSSGIYLLEYEFKQERKVKKIIRE